MYKFSKASLALLSECNSDLQVLFSEVIKYFDCTIRTGRRGKAEQDAAVKAGASKTPWPKSKHNRKPSDAADAYPFPVDLKNRERMIYFAGFVMATGARLYAEKKISRPIRWGGDFNRNLDPADDGWDLPHFESED